MTPFQKKQIEEQGNKMNLEYEFEIVPVVVELYSRNKQCYSNVGEKVKRDGGKIHYGWSVHFNKGVIIEAERHAVWENENEDLICITPNPSDYNEVVFISDNIPVDPYLQIDNVRMNITNNPLVEDWVYLADTVGHLFFKYTTRKNDEQVIIETPVLKLINQIEEWKGLLMGLIELGKKERIICFCENGFYKQRKYLNCHSKFFRKEIPELIKRVKQFEKR